MRRWATSAAKISTVLGVLGVFASPALGACMAETLAEVTSDGEVLITASGQLYHVLPGYDLTSKYWLPTEDVVICDDDVVRFDGESRAIYAIINKDENREHVSAFKGR